MTSSPQPLPSLPPSPGPEPAPVLRRNDEDVAQVWHEDEDTITDARHLNPNAKRRSRKGKERAAESDEDEEDEDGTAVVAGYPPTKEEEEESRRVQEVRAVTYSSRMQSSCSSDCAKTCIMPYASGVIVRSDTRRGPVLLFCFAPGALRPAVGLGVRCTPVLLIALCSRCHAKPRVAFRLHTAGTASRTGKMGGLCRGRIPVVSCSVRSDPYLTPV